MATKLKTMWGEAEHAPTEQQIAASIPSGARNITVRLPEGVQAFDTKAFFKSEEVKENAMCDILVLPFGVDEHSLKLLPPAYTQAGYLGMKHWRLDAYKTHAYVNTAEGPVTFVCPQSVGAQVKGVCPVCDKRYEMLDDTREGGKGKWDPTRLPREIGSEKWHSGFLAHINGTDKVWYVDLRTVPPKTDANKNAARAPAPTFFELVTSAQLTDTVPKSFWATGRNPVWLRTCFKFIKYDAKDGGGGRYWNLISVTAVPASIHGVNAADVKWDRLGDPAYNPCHMIEILPREEIAKIASGIVPFRAKKEAAPTADACWDDIKDLDVDGLDAYAKARGLDLSHIDRSAPKKFRINAIVSHFGITRPAADTALPPQDTEQA